MAIFEQELRDYLVANVASVENSFTKVGTMDIATQNSSGGRSENLTAVAIYANGGETSKIARVRIMTRANKFSTAMTLANDIFDELNYLTNTDLDTYGIYASVGTRPQQSGRDASGGFLTSADYTIRLK